MPYSQVTWLQLRTKLLDRLGDNVFYSDTGAYPEVSLYLREALRIWNVAALYFRDRMSLTLGAGTTWYDLWGEPLFNQTMLDTDLIAEMEHHLLEPVTPALWTGTDMFNLNQLAQALQRRRDQFLLETGIRLLHGQFNLVIAAEGRFELPNNVIDVRRAEFVEANGHRTPLWRSDEWASDSFNAGWNFNPLIPPSEYSVIMTPPLKVQLIPPPGGVGQLDLLTIQSGQDLDPLLGVLMGVPDDFCWAIKYGAMADLLGAEGQARDVPRATYCEQRYRQGVELALLFPISLEAQINGQNVPMSALHDADTQQPDWPNQTGVPFTVATSRNWVVPIPVPNGIFSLTLDVVKPAPIPLLDTDLVQLGPEEMDAILDYAQHIASFKQGGEEFMVTQEKLSNLFKLAAVYNERLKASAVFKRYIEGKSLKEEERRPYREEQVYA